MLGRMAISKPGRGSAVLYYYEAVEEPLDLEERIVGRRPGRRILIWVVLSVALIVAGIFGIRTLIADEPDTGRRTTAYTCPYYGDQEACAKANRDDRSRVQLTAEQSQAAVEELKRLLGVTSDAWYPASCLSMCTVDDAVAGPEAVERVRSVLSDAGYRNAIVRESKAGDSVGDGLIVAAVQVNSACIILTAKSKRIVGPLPDGRCLID
jgi:hypothetical protein